MYKPVFQKREVLVFRQFQRKGWSLFACLGREVVISVLSVATLSAAKAPSISDETWRADSTGFAHEVRLGDVGVTGSRAPLTKSQAARMVTVLSREEIAQAPVQSVNDLLKYAVGVDVRQRGALGSQTDISIRGGTQEQITVLLNGINICDPQTGHNTLDLPVQLDEIVRIEVLQGPAGRVYGTSSLLGAINIVTHPDTTTGADATLEGGSFGYAAVGARANVKGGRWNNQLSAGYRRSDGYSRCKAGTLNTDYQGEKAFYQGVYDDELVHVGWHAGWASKGWGSSTFYATPRWQADDQYEHTTKLFTAIQASTKQGLVRLQPSVYWNQHRDRYEGYRDKPDVMPYNYNRCDVYGLSLNSYFDSPIGRTAIGAELRNEDLVSTNLGETINNKQETMGRYTRGINRTNISAHLEHNVLLRRLTLSAGFVAAKSSWSNQGMTVYPGIDVSYTLLPRSEAWPTTRLPRSEAWPTTRLPRSEAWPTTSLKVFAGWNSSLRLPSFTEMYYKLQGYAADPHLKPEEMQALEVGAQLLAPRVQAKATLYHHHGRNMIDWIMDTREGENAVWRSVNHTRLNAYGLELSSQFIIPFRKTGRCAVVSNSPDSPDSQSEPSGLAVRKVRTGSLERPDCDDALLSLSYSYGHQDKDPGPGIVSQYALEYLRHKVVATLQLPLWHPVSARIGLRWQDRMGSYTTFDGETKPYRPYALADARLQWQLQRGAVYAEVNNLLNNRSYVDFGNVPQPGIWFVAGINWSWR